MKKIEKLVAIVANFEIVSLPKLNDQWNEMKQ